MKCKIIDLVDDLVNVLDVTEMTMDDTGISLGIVKALKEKGVKVNDKVFL